MDPNIPLTAQLSVYRQKMNPFYRTKNINIITENQVKNGDEAFTFNSTEYAEDITRKDYLIDSKNDTPRDIPTEHD